MHQPDESSRSPDGPAPLRSRDASAQRHSAEVSWDVVAKHLERFIAEWEANNLGPMLSDHLPHDNAAHRRSVLIELVKVDLEYRAGSDGPILRLEDYLAENPELGEPDGMPMDLIHEEFHIRQAAGEIFEPHDYLNRFPDRAESIAQLFNLAANEALPTGAELTEEFKPGQRIGDFYLMSNLGVGAFGSVFLARQESMQRTVALKISPDHGTEAQTLAQLDHPNIVRVYDRMTLPDRNLRLLYMQFVAGGTLQAVVKASRSVEIRTGRIVAECIASAVEQTGLFSSKNISLKAGMAGKSWAEVTCQLGMELAQALHYAHGQGILHRDVKPANVLLEANGSARLADFNISFGSQVEGDNPCAHFGGSLSYMSPEQMEACDPNHATHPGDLDARSDVYSLGIVLWELMYGTRPFDDEADAGVIAAGGRWSESIAAAIRLRRAEVRPPPVSPRNAVESQLLASLNRCLKQDPKKRFQTACEVARDLGLSLQPRVARLMHRSQSGWRRRATLCPMVAFLVAAILPHVAAAVFNHFYNDQAIEQLLPDAAGAFFKLVVAVNGIAFSVGIVCCIFYSLPVVRMLRRIHRGEPIQSTAAARARACRLSAFVTVLGISEWVVAGLIYPIGLHINTGGLDLRWYFQFIGSFLICGLIAAAYPFFATATLSIRSFIPTLLRNDRFRPADVTCLHRLAEQSVWSLYLAGGVPAVGIMILLMTQQMQSPNEALDQLGTVTLKTLSVLGAIGFGLVLSLSKSLQTDIDALLDAARLLGRSDDGLDQ